MTHNTASAAAANLYLGRGLKAITLAASLLAGGIATAAPLAFVPPNDQTGEVYTSNANDGWNEGRGIGLQVSSNQTISSVGVLQNLSNQALNYGVYEISSPTNGFNKLQTLRSGGSTVSTVGLDWVDYGFASLTLETGKNYLIEFQFDGNSNENFFYNNGNQAWTQGAYSSLDGTMSNDFGNFVVGAFRIESANTGNNVPEPGALGLVGAGLLGLALTRRRRQA